MIIKEHIIGLIFFVSLLSCNRKHVNIDGIIIRKFYLVNERFDYMDNQVLFYEKRDLKKEEIRCLMDIFKARNIAYYISEDGQLYIESESTKESKNYIESDFDITGEMYLCSNSVNESG